MKGGSHSVRLEGVVKRFGEVAIVDRLSLETAPGEFLTLLGAGGSRKTILLKIIAGLAYPTTSAACIPQIPNLRGALCRHRYPGSGEVTQLPPGEAGEALKKVRTAKGCQDSVGEVLLSIGRLNDWMTSKFPGAGWPRRSGASANRRSFSLDLTERRAL